MISRYLRRATRALSRPRVLLYKNGDSISVHPERGVCVMFVDAASPDETRYLERHVEPEQIDAMLYQSSRMIEGGAL